MKDLVFCGSCEKDLSKFEIKAKQRVLRLFDMLRNGLELHPGDFKYMGVVGDGVYELRVKVVKQYRVFYVVKFDDAIYLLHAFIKKTQQTSRQDIAVGKQRYKTLSHYLRGEKK